MNNISIIIPIYNEFDNIDSLYNEISNTLKNIETYEIIFIDDSSTDKSTELLKKYFNNKLIKAVFHDKNLGQSHALLSGINSANNDTIVTPSFNYDFCKTGMFNVETTPSQVGYFSNFLLSKKSSFRSCHPIFSFVAIGKYAKKITSNICVSYHWSIFICNMIYIISRCGDGLVLPIPII